MPSPTRGCPPSAGMKADHANVSIDAFQGPDQTMVVNAAIDVAVPPPSRAAVR